MIKEIITDEAILSQVSEPATAEDAEIAKDLIDTLQSMKEECVCLAANQIGVLKSIIVYVDPKSDSIHVMYNPKIKRAMKPGMVVEGCLSREEDSVVKRFDIATVSYDALVNGALESRERKVTGWVAQMIQHCIDHCNGVLV